MSSQHAVRKKLRSKLKNTRHRDPSQVRGACPRPKRARISRAEEVGLPFYEAEPAEDGSDLPAVYKLKNERELMTAEEALALKQKTFPARRFLFTRGKDPLAEVQLRFPWLFQEDEVSAFMAL